MIGRPSLRRRSAGNRRGVAPPQRAPTIRRSSARSGRARAIAFLVLIATGLAMFGATSSSAFGFQRLEIDGRLYTDDEVVRSTIGVAAGQNLFSLATDGIVARLRQLTAVEAAAVEIGLPGTLRVRLTERTPIAIWQVGQRRLLVDAVGVAFATAGEADNLPVIDDRRAVSAWLDVGSRIEPVDLDVAKRLGSLRPADIGSAAAALHVSIDDRGFLLDSGSGGWTAEFGLYGPTVRKTERIPGQVRLLASLIAGREPTLDRIILADERTGTYTVKAAP